MDARLEAALLCALERTEAGADVSETWLKEAYPERWEELAGFLGLHERLRGGRPRRATLGPYRILRRLGQGGMGTVYLAETTRAHEGLAAGATVAVKVVHPHLLPLPGFLARTLREARLGKSVIHENVVRTLDVGVEAQDGADAVYLVTEHVEGQNLRGLLHEMEVVPEDLCRHVAREVLRALLAIHGVGIVHRDLKPENILITRAEAVKVMDLGAARPAVELEPISKPAEFFGSILYAAPEQFVPNGDVDGRADLYSLGVVLHELAAGSHPFAESGLVGPARRSTSLGESNPAVSAFFEEFVATLMADGPAGRFQTAAAALRALDGADASEWWTRRSTEMRASSRSALRHARAVRSTPFVGRDSELASLRGQFERAAGGEGRTVVVVGEAGVGKSRLLESFVDGIPAAGPAPHVLRASHDPASAVRAEDAFVAALRGHFDGTVREDELAARLGDLAGLAPAVAALLRGGPAPAGATSLSGESLPLVLASTLRSLADERPTVVVLDDLHFASVEGRALFASVSRALTSARVMLVATTRPPALPDWTAELCAAPHATRVELGRLPPEELRALLVAALGSDDLTERLLPVCARRSDGNPFFLFEILRSLRDDGLLTADGEGRVRLRAGGDEPELPQTLRELVRLRLADVSEEDREILAAAACCGFEFDPLLVAEALGAPTVRVLRRLARLELRRRLIRSVGPRAVFDHHVVQEVLYDGLAPSVAARLHAAIGVALSKRASAETETGGAPSTTLSDDLARHFVRAEDPARAGAHLTASLARLRDGFQVSAVLDLATRALAAGASLPTTTRLAVLSARAESLDALGRRGEQLSTLREKIDAAMSLGDETAAVTARTDAAFCLHHMGRAAEAVSEGELALAAAERLNDPARRREAHLALAVTLGYQGRHVECLVHARRHLEFAAATGNHDVEARALAAVGSALLRQSRCVEALDHLSRAVAMHVASGAAGAASRDARDVRTVYARGLAMTGRYEESVAVLQGLAPATRRAGDLHEEVDRVESLSMPLSYLGRLDEAADCMRAALDLVGRTGNATLDAQCSMRFGRILAWSGRWDEALVQHDRAVDLFRRQGRRLSQVQAATHRSVLLAALGEFAAARDDAEAACATAREERFASALPAALRALAAASGADGRTDVEGLREAVRTAGPDYFPLVRAEMTLALGAAEFDAGDPAAAATLRESLDAARSVNLRLVTVEAMAHLVLLNEIAYEDAARELAVSAAGLPVLSRLRARHLLGRASGEFGHVHGAFEDLASLRGRAPPRCRDSMVANVPLYAAVEREWERVAP